MTTAVSTCAIRSVCRALVFALAVAHGGAGLAACTASAEDVRAPQDQLFFPTGIATTSDERNLFVVNANSELRYDSGSIAVIDVGVVQDVIARWLANPETEQAGCSRDPDHSETLICEEAQFFRKDAAVRVGNFATDLAVQDFTPTGGITRVFVPTRGDPSITWADFFNGSLHCTLGTDSYALCDDSHRLTSVLNSADLAQVPPEPFGVFADATSGFAMVTHLSTGSVTLIRAPAESSRVGVVDVINNVFAGDPTTGLSGATGIAGHRPNSKDPVDMVYVASNTERRVQTFTVGLLDSGAGVQTASYLLPGNFFFLNAVGINAGDSNNSRGIQFSPTGDRLYIANRSPPTLQIYDTSLTASGVPRNVVGGASDICRAASTVSVLDPGDGERAYVTCFQDGQIYIVDPTGQSHVEDIITVGRGPYGSATISGTAPARKLLFVSNFLEDTIAVIDLTPGSARRNRVVLRIGTPRTP